MVRTMETQSQVNSQDIQYYDHLQKVLTCRQQDKAMQFFKAGLIEYNNDGTYTVKAMKGYNTRNYLITPHQVFHFECNCQGWQTKYQRLVHGDDIYPTCSHVSALYIHFKTRYSEDWESAKQMLKDFSTPFKQTTLC